MIAQLALLVSVEAVHRTVPARSASAAVPDAAPACTVATRSHAVRLPDGGRVLLDPSSISRNGSELLVLGTPTTLWPAGAERQSSPRSQDEAIGVVVDSMGRAEIVPSPLERETYMARATSAGPGAWDVVFFTTDVARPLMQHVFDSATIWTGRLVGRRWRGVRPIADVRDALLLPDHSSGLVRHRGELRFAFSFRFRMATEGRPYRRPGIVMLRGLRDGRWHADTLILPTGPSATLRLAPVHDTATLVVYSAEDFRPGYIGPYALHRAVFTDRWGAPRVVVRDSVRDLDLLEIDAGARGWAMTWRREQFLDGIPLPDTLRWGRLGADDTVRHVASLGENLPAARPAVIGLRGGRTLLVAAGREPRVLRAYLAGDADVTLLSQFAAPVSLPRLRSVVLDDQRVALWTTSEGADESEPFVASHLVLVRLHCDSARERQRSTPSRERGKPNARDANTLRDPGDMRRRNRRMP